jgi:uncharacterized protein (DUF1778 family)
MVSETTNESRLNVRLPANLKEVIEEAAATLGQSASDFAVSTLVQTARSAIQQRDATELSNRDRDIFLAMLDDANLKPNKALKDAVARYKKHLAASK